MDKLTEQTRQLIQEMFAPERHEEVESLLENKCSNDKLHANNENQLERVRFAILKLSEGDMEEFYSAIKHAQTDWRDTLMAAGFGNDLARHKKWAERVLTGKEEN